MLTKCGATPSRQFGNIAQPCSWNAASLQTGEAVPLQSDIADLAQCAIAAIIHHHIAALRSFGNSGSRTYDDAVLSNIYYNVHCSDD